MDKTKSLAKLIDAQVRDVSLPEDEATRTLAEQELLLVGGGDGGPIWG